MNEGQAWQLKERIQDYRNADFDIQQIKRSVRGLAKRLEPPPISEDDLTRIFRNARMWT